MLLAAAMTILVAPMNSVAAIRELFSDFAIVSNAAEAYEADNGIVYEIVSGVAKIAGYNGSATELVIPEKINGNVVTEIADRVFEGKNLTSVTIPASITEIDYYYDAETDTDSYEHGPFAGSSVKKVTFAEGTTVIPAYILAGCRYLEELVLPSSVQQIKDGAFMYCSALISVKLPEKLEAIDEEAFAYCSKLSGISLPDATATLGGEAFYNCLSLKTAELNNVSFLGEKCFVGTALSQVTIPATIVTTDYYYNAETDTDSYEHGPFAGKNLKKVTFEKGLSVIPAFVLGGCRGVTEIILSEGVREIGKGAFEYCTSLAAITLPEGLETIKDEAFEGCTALSKIALPDATGFLGADAFYNCTSLKEVDLNSASSLGDSCFVGTAISQITIPATMKETDFYYNAESDTISYEHGPFAGNNLKKVTFAEGITTIPAYVLGGCRGVTEILIPEGVTEIGKGAFEFCTNVTEILLPDSLKVIKDEAFVGCSKLKFLRLYDSIKTVEECSFDGLYILTREDNEAVKEMIDNEISYRAIVAGIKDKEYRLLDRSNSSYTLKKESDNTFTLQLRFDFKEDVKASITKTAIKIRIPAEIGYEYLSVTVDGKKHTDFTIRNGIISINALTNKGVITVKGFKDIDDTFSSYAAISGKNGKADFSEVIGIINPMNYAKEYEITLTEDKKLFACGEEVFTTIGKLTVKELLEKTNADKVTDKNGNAVAENAVITTGMILSKYTGNIEVDFRQLAILGSIDDDITISAADARLALRASVGLESYAPDTAQFVAADADRDGKLSSADARLILRVSVGLETLS